jgi:hypothetical protein
MKEKYAVLGYSTIDIGDDIQSFITSTLLPIAYIIVRDDYDKIYDFQTGNIVSSLDHDVYLIMNGWFMHNPDWRSGNNKIKFPIRNPKIKPIYISSCFSQDVPALYTKECIDHYKENSPILCRDMTTYSLLQKHNVDIEFFGCVTQLLDFHSVNELPECHETYKDSIIYIDCPYEWKKRDKKENNVYIEHYQTAIGKKNPRERIEYAHNLLSRYKIAKKIYTGRLHAFLPCRAMGLNVEYVGDLNYRVKDLVNTTPDKELLRQRFFDFINKKVSSS